MDTCANCASGGSQIICYARTIGITQHCLGTASRLRLGKRGSHPLTVTGLHPGSPARPSGPAAGGLCTWPGRAGVQPVTGMPREASPADSGCLSDRATRRSSG
jgi:hypothetical protein